ncbi:MAG: aspartate--tRNA ligase [Firmicutes bacterium]|nr:aspartate--tRNA ligase [Bacillota bacterium]
MNKSIAGMKRTHYCGEITKNLIGEKITVMGWVNKQRDLPTVIFIVVRDRTGIFQIAVSKENADFYSMAKTIRTEYVVAATGTVIARTIENVNPNMPTGEVELDVTELRILSESEVPPFQVAEEDVGIDLRLKYRYIDLRRPEAQKIMFLRHKTAQVARKFLTDEGFIEVETPVLTKSSPEGARDYLVASRTHPGQFYALPQSPQLFKQLLMISGFDKYFQIVKCYRDEDLRADRQPEFTQIDIELSFVDMEDVIEVNERMMKTICKEVLAKDIKTPFPRISYNDAMERYGSDKPDTRFAMELHNITNLVAGSDFGVFQGAIDSGGSVRGILAENSAKMPRKQIDSLVELVKQYKAKGLAWIAINEDGSLKTTLSKFFDEQKLQAIVENFGGKPNDMIFLCADKNEIVLDSLGALRLEIAKRNNLVNSDDLNLLWVVDFPLLEWSEEDNRFYARHHPFTAPMDEDLPLLEKGENLQNIRAKAYDMVLNGYEIVGGSIRIHQQEVQKLMFKTLNFAEEDAEKGFGFFLEALKYGTPPHGGTAWGFDRLVMLFTGADSLREVIAFPKVKDASCPTTHAPSVVEPSQLAELGIIVK